MPSRRLKPSLPFYGVTPGHSLPLGQVELPVTLGSRDNFRTENVIFIVVELPLPYNAILERPALTRFMVVAHYNYLTVKMPGPAGPISVTADSGSAFPASSSRTWLWFRPKLRSKAAQGAQDPLHPNPDSLPTPLFPRRR